MPAKISLKIDRFYLLLAIALTLLAALIIFTFKGIFSAFNTAREIDETVVVPETRINRSALDKAYEAVINKKIFSLDLAQ